MRKNRKHCINVYQIFHPISILSITLLLLISLNGRCLLVPRRIFLKGFIIYGHGGHLIHVTSIMSSDFYFHVPESFYKKIGSDW